MAEVIRVGSTEAQYQAWLDAHGPCATGFQEHHAAEVIRFARELDQNPYREPPTEGLRAKRARLLSRLRSASREFREARRAWDEMKLKENSDSVAS